MTRSQPSQTKVIRPTLGVGATPGVDVTMGRVDVALGVDVTIGVDVTLDVDASLKLLQMRSPDVLMAVSSHSAAVTQALVDA